MGFGAKTKALEQTSFKLVELPNLCLENSRESDIGFDKVIVFSITWEIRD